MNQGHTLLFLSVWGASALSLLGFSTDGSSVARTCDAPVAITNSPIVITATFTNRTAEPLRGFFYSEQLPTALLISNVSVKLNGQGITNAILEAGQDGDVYAGFTPWRWRLETPTNFAEAHPVPQGAAVEIRYSLTSAALGSFACPEFAWTGYRPLGSNALFGCSETADQLTVYFVSSTNRASVSAQYTSNGSSVSLVGASSVSYVLETSHDLATWTPLTTNVCCFTFLDTNSTRFASRWYRGRVFLGQ